VLGRVVRAWSAARREERVDRFGLPPEASTIPVRAFAHLVTRLLGDLPRARFVSACLSERPREGEAGAVGLILVARHGEGAFEERDGVPGMAEAELVEPFPREGPGGRGLGRLVPFLDLDRLEVSLRTLLAEQPTQGA
jgi:hypothetical protein